MSQQIGGDDRDAMVRRRVAMSDGRYMYYYTFGDAESVGGEVGSASQSSSNEASSRAQSMNNETSSDLQSTDDTEGNDV